MRSIGVGLICKNFNLTAFELDTVMKNGIEVDAFMPEALTRIDRPLGFWEWLDRVNRDVFIVCDLLEELIALEGWQIVQGSVTGGPDMNRSPDVVARTINGERLAFELTEWVDQKHLEAMIKAKRRLPRFFTAAEVRQGVEECIARKRGKTLAGGIYDLRVLVIHSAQESFPDSVFADLQDAYSKADLAPWDHAYFMLPPLIGSKLPRDPHCRYINLHRYT